MGKQKVCDKKSRLHDKGEKVVIIVYSAPNAKLRSSLGIFSCYPAPYRIWPENVCVYTTMYLINIIQFCTA